MPTLVKCYYHSGAGEVVNACANPIGWHRVLEEDKEFIVIDVWIGRRLVCRYENRGNNRYWYGCDNGKRHYLGPTSNLSQMLIQKKCFNGQRQCTFCPKEKDVEELLNKVKEWKL